MDDKITFFYCGNELVGMQNWYSQNSSTVFCEENKWKHELTLEFTGFVFVEITKGVHHD